MKHTTILALVGLLALSACDLFSSDGLPAGTYNLVSIGGERLPADRYGTVILEGKMTIRENGTFSGTIRTGRTNERDWLRCDGLCSASGTFNAAGKSVSFTLDESSFDDYRDDLGLRGADSAVNATIDGNTVTFRFSDDDDDTEEVEVIVVVKRQ